MGWFILARLEGINSWVTVGGWRVHEAFSPCHPRRLKNLDSFIVHHRCPSDFLYQIWDSYSFGLQRFSSCSTLLRRSLSTQISGFFMARERPRWTLLCANVASYVQLGALHIYSSSENFLHRKLNAWARRKRWHMSYLYRFKSLLIPAAGPTLRYEGHFESPGFVWQGLSPDPPILTLPQPPLPGCMGEWGTKEWGGNPPCDPTYLCPNNRRPSHQAFNHS